MEDPLFTSLSMLGSDVLIYVILYEMMIQVLRRLAQNREAARKSRLRKKV